MLYFKTIEDEKGLWIEEQKYNWKFTNKTESVFVSSNGYFGIRGTHDFSVINQSRGMFVSGLYAKENTNEVNELINCPDIAQVQLMIDGTPVSLDTASIGKYVRRYNVYNGELQFLCEITLDDEKKVKIITRRFASFADRHLFCHEINITPINFNSDEIKIISGINGQITNSGVSHFENIECRVFDNKCLKYQGDTQTDKLEVYLVSDYSANIKDKEFSLKRRSIFEKCTFELRKNETLTICRIGYINTAKNGDTSDETKTCAELQNVLTKGYNENFVKHKFATDKFWKYAQINIDGISLDDKAAIAFAQYQLYAMTPSYTDKCSIAAKGLSGEGYKGHVFWDTELFMLPFYYYTYPEIAKKLLMYRYYGLNGAKKKAKEYGYDGAMYPWESTMSGEEETPLFAALNIHTGKAQPVWSGRKEHHVSADIAYAIIKYYEVTNDVVFMRDYGMEMLINISRFWVSRATEKNNRLEILDIIGPDEYNEHIDNNAFTNYMVRFCVAETIKLIETIKNEEYYDILEQKTKVSEYYEKFKFFVENIYIPEPDENGIIPQDDTFMAKKPLQDIEKYKQSLVKQSVLLDYSRDEVVDMQVLKQADVVMLLNLFPDIVQPELLKKNVLFYEARTLHDSSLSYCAHAQACANIGESEMGHAFFEKAKEIDINDNPYDSVDGLHSASLGGIWNCLIQGFAGVSVSHNLLTVNPHLPAEWNKMNFFVKVGRSYVYIEITKEEILVKVCDRNEKIKIQAANEIWELKGEEQVNIKIV